jgi:hypothetical protein
VIEFIEESSDELFITRNVREAFLLLGRQIHYRDPLERPIMLTH